MSNLFGVPPPPPSQLFGPRPAATAAVPEQPWIDPDPHPGRRRTALFLAFLAGGLLVFANLATWLHQDGVNPRQAPVVAAATYDSTVVLLTPELRRTLFAKVTPASSNPQDGAPSTGALDPQISTDIDAAISAAFASPAARAEWDKGITAALTQTETLLTGATLPGDQIVVVLDTTALAAPIASSLTTAGYDVDAATLALEPYRITVDAPSGSTASTLGTLSDLWLVLWAGTIGLGAAAIALAPRRLRLAKVLAIDAAFMLAVCLLLVPLLRQVADDLAPDPAQVPVVSAAYDALAKSLISQTLVLMAVSVATAIVLTVIARRGGRSRSARGPA